MKQGCGPGLSGPLTPELRIPVLSQGQPRQVWVSPPMALLPRALTTLSLPPRHTDTSIFCSLKITCYRQRTGCSTPRPTRCPSVTGTAPPWPGTATNPLSPHPCLRDASTLLGSGTVLRGTGDGRPIVGQPWTDVSDRRLLFLCEETGAGGCTSIGPRLWSLEPIHSFLWGDFCTPPPTCCHRAKGLEVCIATPWI